MDLFDLFGAGLNLYGAVKTSQAAEKAADAQERAALQATENFRPYADLGDYSAGVLQSQLTPNALLKDFSMEDFRADPGYRFRLREGEKAIDRSAGARGKRYSGATLKDLHRFAQGLASNEYSNAYARDNTNKTRRYNMLAGGVNAGQGAQGTVGSFLSNAGAANAAGTIGANNAIWQGVGDAYNVLADAKYGRRPYNSSAPYVYRT